MNFIKTTIGSPVEERLQAMEALWDSLCHDLGPSLESPSWHGEILTVRVERLDAGVEVVDDWPAARSELQAGT